MADKELIVREEVEHSGLFDFKSLYSFSHAWFADEKYGVDETRYSEKVSGDSRNLLIQWMASKILSDYFKYEIQIDFEVKNLTEVEVDINGSRKKMNKGSVKISIKGALVKDHESKWETSTTNRFLRDVYNKFIIPSRVNDMRIKVSTDVKAFKDEVKSFLDLIGKR
jgi:hypothetical protein